MRGCQAAGATRENSRGRREAGRAAEGVPSEFLRPATWLGSRWMVLWVNQPRLLLYDCCRSSMRLPSPGFCTRTTSRRSVSWDEGRVLRTVSVVWVIAVVAG